MYLVRCVEIGREIQAHRGKQRRDLAGVIAERLPGAAIELLPARLIVHADGPDDAAARIAALPGVTSVSPCHRVAATALEPVVVAVARPRLVSGASFAIRVRRRGARPTGATPSLELARRLGDAVATATGARIDLTNPDVTIGIELRGDDAFVFDRVVHGVDRTGPAVRRADGPPRFVADQMLGRLAARLRLLGYDTLTVFDLADSEVTRLAADDGRILLTRDGGLAQTRAVPVHRVIARAPRAQLAEVLAAFALTPDPARYFTRCTACNTLVEPTAEAAVVDALPAGVRGRGLAFWRCPACARVYWHGSHVERILADLTAAGAPAP